MDKKTKKLIDNHLLGCFFEKDRPKKIYEGGKKVIVRNKTYHVADGKIYDGQRRSSLSEVLNIYTLNELPKKQKVLDRLLDAGLNIDDEENRCWTELMLRCRHYHRNEQQFKWIFTLIERGADINYQCKYHNPDYKVGEGFGNYTYNPFLKQTPLTIAANNSVGLEVVKLLVDCGADINLASAEGTALDIAKQNGYRDIEIFLENWKLGKGK